MLPRIVSDDAWVMLGAFRWVDALHAELGV